MDRVGSRGRAFCHRDARRSCLGEGRRCLRNARHPADRVADTEIGGVRKRKGRVGDPCRATESDP